MSESLPPIKLIQSTWVDIYAVTGITPGTKIIIQNTGESEAQLTESAGEPVGKVGVNTLAKNDFLTNTDANIGAWAFSDKGTELQVEVSA